MIKINSIKKGSLVKVDPGFCFCKYSQFIIRHPQYMLRWSYRNYPNSNSVYQIIGIHRDKGGKIIVIRNTACAVAKCNPIFLMDEKGIILGEPEEPMNERPVESSWERLKHLIDCTKENVDWDKIVTSYPIPFKEKLSEVPDE